MGQEDQESARQHNAPTSEDGMWPQTPLPFPLFDAVPGWTIDVEKAATTGRAKLPDIDACEVVAGGTAIIGVGKKSTMYIWRLNTM